MALSGEGGIQPGRASRVSLINILTKQKGLFLLWCWLCCFGSDIDVGGKGFVLFVGDIENKS